MVRGGIPIFFVFRSCRQGCGLQKKSLARINFAIVTKGIAETSGAPNCFARFLAGMVRVVDSLSVANLLRVVIHY